MFEARYFFPLVFLLSAFFTVVSFIKFKKYFSNKHQFECPAQTTNFRFLAPFVKRFEIAIKRPYLLGVVPFDARFEILNPSNRPLRVFHRVSIREQRKDLSGNRIVPVAEFEITEPGEHILLNHSKQKFKEKDMLLIGPKSDSNIIWIVLGLIISSMFSISAFVISVLVWSGNL